MLNNSTKKVLWNIDGEEKELNFHGIPMNLIHTSALYPIALDDVENAVEQLNSLRALNNYMPYSMEFSADLRASKINLLNSKKYLEFMYLNLFGGSQLTIFYKNSLYELRVDCKKKSATTMQEAFSISKSKRSDSYAKIEIEEDISFNDFLTILTSGKLVRVSSSYYNYFYQALFNAYPKAGKSITLAKANQVVASSSNDFILNLKSNTLLCNNCKDIVEVNEIHIHQCECGNVVDSDNLFRFRGQHTSLNLNNVEGKSIFELKFVQRKGKSVSNLKLETVQVDTTTTGNIQVDGISYTVNNPEAMFKTLRVTNFFDKEQIIKLLEEEAMDLHLMVLDRLISGDSLTLKNKVRCVISDINAYLNIIKQEGFDMRNHYLTSISEEWRAINYFNEDNFKQLENCLYDCFLAVKNKKAYQQTELLSVLKIKNKSNILNKFPKTINVPGMKVEDNQLVVDDITKFLPFLFEEYRAGNITFMEGHFKYNVLGYTKEDFDKIHAFSGKKSLTKQQTAVLIQVVNSVSSYFNLPIIKLEYDFDAIQSNLTKLAKDRGLNILKLFRNEAKQEILLADVLSFLEDLDYKKVMNCTIYKTAVKNSGYGYDIKNQNVFSKMGFDAILGSINSGYSFGKVDAKIVTMLTELFTFTKLYENSSQLTSDNQKIAKYYFFDSSYNGDVIALLTLGLELNLDINKLFESVLMHSDSVFYGIREVIDTLNMYQKVQHLIPDRKFNYNNLEAEHDFFSNLATLNEERDADFTGIYQVDEVITLEDTDFNIISPKNTLDLIIEGTSLNHCVGSYTDIIANRKECVLFFRKEKHKSYYTFSINSNMEIIEMSGKNNKKARFNLINDLEEYIKQDETLKTKVREFYQL